MAEPVIVTEKLSRHFGEIRAVQDLDLEIPAGVIFGLLGPNGSGKTTTVRLLLGLLEPTSGSARVLGHDTREAPNRIREESGVLLEHDGLYERLTAVDNLDFYARLWHLSAPQRQARIEELLRDMGLWERRREKVSTWSKGMKQKLAIARALLHRPRLVFLDEPTSGLDPVAAVGLREELAKLARKEGVIIFLNTHYLAEAEKLCDLVGIIRSGRLIKLGTVAEVRRERASLEDAFLALMEGDESCSAISA